MLYPFPADFVWGTATASYQVEGAAHEDGRGPSIWDAFSSIPTKVKNNDTGDIACNHYHLFKEDIRHMKRMGLKNYRLSFSWSRLLPVGNLSVVNPKGIEFYNNVINELLRNDIQPLVTLYHWDLPLGLEMGCGGWLSKKTIHAFQEYANFCFEHFGDRVKQWLTFNEPWCSAVLGYEKGIHAPGRTSSPGEHVYEVAHNILLAHGEAVQTYRRRYQDQQKGIIGITLNCDWREPKFSVEEAEYQANQEAAERALIFYLGWLADVIYLGDYPDIMKQRVGDRLPKFTAEEKTLLKGSSDFFGLNHYSSALAEPSEDYLSNNSDEFSYWKDQGTLLSNDPSWKTTDLGWFVVPEGLGKLVEWIQNRYHPKGGIWITENGCAMENGQDPINDVRRVEFFRSYLLELHKAIVHRNVDVRAYFAWSFMDNMEWADGYSVRFGLHYVDYKTFERTPKLSANFFSQIIANNGVEDDEKETKIMEESN